MFLCIIFATSHDLLEHVTCPVPHVLFTLVPRGNQMTPIFLEYFHDIAISEAMMIICSSSQRLIPWIWARWMPLLYKKRYRSWVNQQRASEIHSLYTCILEEISIEIWGPFFFWVGHGGGDLGMYFRWFFFGLGARVDEEKWNVIIMNSPWLVVRKFWDVLHLHADTPWKFSEAPDNLPFQKENSLPTIIFQGLGQTSRV